MPRTRKVPEGLADAVPTAERAVTYLNEQGQKTLAASVQTVLAFAQDSLEADPAPNRAIALDKAQVDHVRTVVKEQNVDLANLVRERMREFCAGTWAPDKPARVGRGQGLAKDWINVRVPDGLWATTQGTAKNAATKLGYRLNIRQVVAAILDEAFPMFDDWPVRKMVGAYRRGTSAADLAEEHGYSEEAVQRMIQQQGLTLREREETSSLRPLSGEEVKELVRRYQAHEGGTSTLAEEFGVAKSVVIRTLEQEGIERRKSRTVPVHPSVRLTLPRELRDHVKQVADTKEIDDVVQRRMNDFVSGAWVPGKPKPAPRGDDRGFLNVHIPQDLIDAVDRLGKDETAVAERGYALSHQQVAIATLATEYPLPS